MYKKLSFLVASIFGVGFAPFASGTLGSLVSLPLIWLVWYYDGVVGILSLSIVAFILGCIATKEVIKHTKHDPSLVVIDEMVGQAITFIFVAKYMHIWWVYVLGFILFRLFDILKVGPVKWADEKVENEYGVMLDDVFAGLMAAIVLYGIIKF